MIFVRLFFYLAETDSGERELSQCLTNVILPAPYAIRFLVVNVKAILDLRLQILRIALIESRKEFVKIMSLEVFYGSLIWHGLPNVQLRFGVIHPRLETVKVFPTEYMG
jgi:hypothetical protein